MTGHYDPWLVTLSVVIASLASYTALNLAGGITASAGRVRLAWLAGGSIALGVGIWSMHFIGMLAFRLPTPMTYRVPELFLSVAVAVLASGLALGVVAHHGVRRAELGVAGLLMGGAIAGMHYIGMAGLRVAAPVSWHPTLVVASVGVAVVASLAALWLAFRFRHTSGTQHLPQKAGAAVVMGLAIAGMHYTAMAAARFGPPTGHSHVPEAAILATDGLATTVVAATLFLLGLALLGLMGDRWMRAKAAETAALRRSEQILRESHAALERSEAALRQTTELLQTVIRSSPLAIITMNRAGYITTWNLAAERIFGWTEREVLGRPSPVVRDEQRPEVEALLTRVRRDGPLTGLEVTRQRKDGAAVELSLSVAPLHGAHGEIEGYVALAADVTEEKRLQRELAQSQKLEAMGQIAGGVAHDFNNILTAITGLSAFVLRELPAETPAHRDMVGIQQAAARAAELTSQLLAFSRRQVVRPAPLDLNAVVLEVVQLLERVLPAPIRLDVLLSPEPVPIFADRGQVHQVLLNLALNARDAMPTGGTLTIETAGAMLGRGYAQEHLRVEPGRYVMLAVSDTGAGMTPEVQAKIFEPFFTTKAHGTGLGLATVFGIVRQAGGHVFVYSEPGAGTSLKVYWPYYVGAELADAAPAAPPRWLHGTETVLVVDDDPAIREIAGRTLREYGYHVLAAASPTDALHLAGQERGPIHLLVTDVMMPFMTGRELAIRLTAARPALRVLYMSGYTENAIVHQGALDPGVEYLPKPFAPDELAAKVRTILDAPGEAAQARHG